MATLTENATRIANALDDIKSSIVAKGQTPTGKCETYADAINRISVGVNVSDTTATASDVVNTKYFYNSYGQKTQGLLSATQGTINIVPTATGGGTIISPGTNKVYSSCLISYDGVKLDDTAYLLEGNSIYTVDDSEVTSTLYEGTMSNNGAVTETIASGETYTIPAGYHNGNGTVTATGGGGTDVSDTTATASDVVSGKIFHTANGTKTTGTLTVPKVKTGTFTSNNNGVTITCGFRPKYICITCGDSKGLVASVDTSVYVSGASHPYISYYRTTANALVQETDANAEVRFYSISSTGFTYKSRFNGNTCTYFAVG